MIKQLLCQLFSGRCKLKSLRIDISNELRGGSIHYCLASNSDLSSNLIQYQLQSCNITLLRLHIRLNRICFLENLIEYVLNLEQMSVEFHSSSVFNSSWKSNVETLKKSNKNWFNKIPKLQCFSLKTFIFDDMEFVYLKWLLNRFNYVEKLQLHLKSDYLIDTGSQNIWKSFIDANFIRQYCLPDTIPNLMYFDFYICSQCQLSYNDIEKIINSFKIHSFFINHQWTNVKCLFDPIMSSQHLFSSFTNTSQFSNNQINYPFIFNWPYIDKLFSHLHPSLYLFLERFNELSPNVSCIKVYKQRSECFNESDCMMSSEILFKMRQYNEIDIPFRNVTKLQFGTHFDRSTASRMKPINRNLIREKVLAHLISMTVQLKCLLVEEFEWLLHVVQYASKELRTNALSTVRYAGFCLSSCHIGYEITNIGKHLMPFLSTYMPHLQTLCLWRPDDFPWTTSKFILNKQN
ncbi:unnamed protein product [Rotaria magnacalcarata]|uniref:Uncharacterized protein n=2 Tax=Rotaria magnacalcarata TaxID=392030 RepID=A0A815SPJ8_9BILA|nr:unnamed protein product [Rotaria magnacalcarata]